MSPAPTPKYTPQQRAQFVLWFAESNSDCKRLKGKVRSVEGVNAIIPDLTPLDYFVWGY